MLNKIFKFLDSKYIIIVLITSPLWAFLVVNMIDYENSIFSFNCSNLSYINLSLQAKKEGIELYFSILTITGLILAIIQFLSSNEQSERANEHLKESINQTQIAINQLDNTGMLVNTSAKQLNLMIKQRENEEKVLKNATINGLLEELRHNINLVKDTYLTFDEEETYREIRNLLKVKDLTIYPIIHENNKLLSERLSKLCKIEKFKTNEGKFIYWTYFTLRTDFISSVITSNSFFNTDMHRIFLNLGHLYYSIISYNEQLVKYNYWVEKTFEYIITQNELTTLKCIPIIDEQHLSIIKGRWEWTQDNYFHRLHFRLYFMLIDLIYSFDIEDFIDKKYVSDIKQIIGEV